MARPPRLQFEGALYHVFPRGNRKELIAHSDQDYRVLEKYLIETAQLTGAIPRCWHPMPNHTHALIETPFANISEFMQRWLGRYARYYNWVYEKVGHVFQGRFGSRLVQSDAYQKELIRYIHLNPHRMKGDPTEVLLAARYSSHRFYIGETCPDVVWPWIEPMLKLFGRTLEEARKNYARFLADGLRDGNWQDFYKPKDGVLGDADFIKKIRARHRLANPPPHQTGIPPAARAERLFDEATRTFQVSLENLKSPSQKRDMSRVRQAIAYVGRIKMRLPVVALAQLLGRDHSTVSLLINRAEQTCPPEIERLMKALKLQHFNV